MADSEFDRRFRQLQEKYIDRTERRLQRIEELGEQLAATGMREDAEELHNLVHRLAGSGETLGYPKITEVSAQLEETLETILDTWPPEDTEWLPALSTYCEEIRQILQSDWSSD